MSDDAMDSDVREVIRRRIALRERDGHERLLLNHEALRALLDAADERDQLAAAVERVRALHVPDSEGFCVVCDYMTPHPCPTLRALDGTDE